MAQRTLGSGLRKWVGEQTRFDLGYTEQLYTFGDHGRHLAAHDEGARVVSVGYLALTRPGEPQAPGTRWRGWYQYFPWEDWREARPALIDGVILPALKKFVKESAQHRRRRNCAATACVCASGEGGLPWDEEKVLERYELLYEAGLVHEAGRDAGKPAKALAELGSPMLYDHRRILATAIARLRGKMKYRPVVFELMAPSFTLLELQRTVEALSGARLHKQNFRRLVAEQGLVEGTGKFSTPARGRPAELFRFRREEAGANAPPPACGSPPADAIKHKAC